MEPIDDRELDALLRQWKTPEPPAGLRAALFPARLPWWRRSIRVPVPVAACVLLLMGAGAWRWVAPPRVGAPERRQMLSFRELRPVAELRPRIIRRQHAAN